MRIVHLIMMMQTGGAESLLVDVVNCQAAAGHRVSVVVMNNDSRPTPLMDRVSLAVSFHYVGRPPGSRNPWHVLRLNALLLRLRPHVVHSHNIAFPDMVYAVPLARQFYTAHNVNYKYHKYRRVGKIAAIFAISRAVAAEAATAHMNNVVLAENGIRIGDIRRKPNYERRGALRVVMVSRLLLAQKAQDTLLQALKLTKADIAVDLIGEGPDEDSLRQMAGPNVRFLGNCPREWVYDHLADYDLLVQSSRLEGFGLTVAEGMAAGLPVLVSDNGGPLEIVSGGEHGMVFRTLDAAHLAEQLDRVAAMPAAQLAQWGAKSVARAADYSLDALLRTYHKHYC